MDSTFLKYGDCILLYAENAPGFLQSQGFTNHGCYIQKQPKKTKQLCRNYRDFVFKVEPRMNYDAQKEFDDITKIKNKNAIAKNQANQVPNKELEQEIEKKLKLYRNKMQDEEENNKRLAQMKAGEHVTYGNEIQLRHVDSQGFVSANKV